jgi:hypothetical protein
MVLRELSWSQFIYQHHIRNLTLQEQVKRYHYYQEALSAEIYRQNKGRKDVIVSPEIPDTFFILQENTDFVLQEDGSKLVWAL